MSPLGILLPFLLGLVICLEKCSVAKALQCRLINTKNKRKKNVLHTDLTSFSMQNWLSLNTRRYLARAAVLSDTTF